MRYRQTSGRAADDLRPPPVRAHARVAGHLEEARVLAGVVHCTLDDGRFPSGNQSRIQWEGLDGSTMEAIGRIPIDVGRADAFLRLPEKLGNAMDLDHVATVILAHWPGQSSPWYEDLRRIAAYTNVVGTFTTIDEYFRQTGMTGQQTLYLPDQYRAPYLKQAVAADAARSDLALGPLLRSADDAGIVAVVRRPGDLVGPRSAATGASCADEAEERMQAQAAEVQDLQSQVEDSLAAASPDGGPVDKQLQRRLSEAVARFGQALGGSAKPSGSQPAGCLVANPWSFSRRVCLEMPGLAQPPDVVEGGTVRAAWEKSVVVDVPPMGFAWVGAGSGASQPAESAAAKSRWLKSKSKPEPPMAEGNVLRNDFFEVTLDPHTGAIRSISDYQSRDSRIAQQIALRMPGSDDLDADDDAHYSIMAADEIAVTSPGPLLGEIVCRGRLVDRTAQRVAGFTQTTRVRRGGRVVELILDVQPDRLPRRDAWNSYYAARFAWSDATAEPLPQREPGQPADGLRAARIAALHRHPLRQHSDHVAHRRIALPSPLRTAQARHAAAGPRRAVAAIPAGNRHRSAPSRAGGPRFPRPETALRQIASPPLPSGWLFHLDVRNVIATHWEPWAADGRLQGVRVRLLETDGRKTRLGLRSFRPVAAAQKINPGERPPTELTVDGDQTTVSPAVTNGPRSKFGLAVRISEGVAARESICENSRV